MISHLIKIFIRTLKTRRLYSVVTLLSLTLSIAAAGLIYIFIKHEITFDKFHPNANRIYRIETNIYMPRLANPNFRVPALSEPLIERIRAEIPGIQKSTRFLKSLRDEIIHISNQTFSEKLTYVDNDFFSMFSFGLLRGNFQTPFTDNSDIIITETIANKYFGDSDPIGRIISVEQVDEKKDYIVRGLIRNPPDNSSINFELLVPIESYKYYPDYRSLWNEHNYSFFVQLKDDYNRTNLESSLNRLAKASKESIVRKEDSLELSVTPLTEIHWNIAIPWDKSSNPQNIKVLTGIVLIIIIMACSNFISLSLVTSSNRRVEVGIKKIFGANRMKLAGQFIIESVFYTLVSAFLGLVLVFLLLPYFNSITEINLSIKFDLLDLNFFLILIACVGVLAGSYPAFILSSFNPSEILKSHTVFKIRYSMVSVLVLFQAMLSLFLGTSSLIMSRQMHFVNSKDLGFNHDQVIVLPTFTSGDEAVRVITKFKNSASKETSIKSVAACSNAFFGGLSSMGFTSKDGERKSSKAYSVDEDFIETFGLEIEEGRNFSVEQLSDSDAVIVNRKLANEISDSPLGDSFTWGSGQSSQVIGILKDFNFRSLEFPIDPLFLTMNKQMIRPSVLLIKAKEQNVEYALKRIEAIFMETDPDKPFEFKFLSNVVQAQYHSYRMWTTIIQFSSLFSAFIACIGLFALTGIDASNKYKEIGIRKVFGANTNQILLKISRRYIVLILVASMVGAAVSYSIMSNWILNFAFRINIDWKIYAQGIFIGLIIFIISIGYHSLNAARTNPAETLKHEG